MSTANNIHVCIYKEVILELSEREKFCDNFRISGKSCGQNFGFPYTFYTFSLLPQLKIVRGQLSPKSHSRMTPGQKETGCTLKTTELLDCALKEVCAVIRSNTVVILSAFDIFQKVVVCPALYKEEVNLQTFVMI